MGAGPEPRGDRPEAAPRVVVPSIVLGLGRAGREIVLAVRDEGGDRGPRVHEHARFLTWSPGEGGLGEAFGAALKELLGVEHTIRAGRELRGTVPLDVLVVAGLDDGDLAPAELAAALARLDEGFRPFAGLLAAGGGEGRVFASPILLLPDMDASDGEAGALRDEVVSLLAAWAPRFVPDPARRELPLARCWLVEPRTSEYLLGGATRVAMVRSFLRFLLYGSLRTDADRYQRIFEPRDDPDPFGSFVVGCAELPGGAVRELAGVEAAQRVLAALEQPSQAEPGETLRGYGESAWLEELLATLPTPGAAKDIARTIERQLPDVAATVEPTRLLERPRHVLARYDKTWLSAAADRLRVGEGQAPEVRRAVEKVVHDMARAGSAGVGTTATALERELDAWLTDDNAAHHLDAQSFLAEVENGVELRRREVAAEASAEPDPGPDAGALRSAVEALHTAVEEKPDPGLMVVLGAMLTVLLVAVGRGLVPLVAGIFERPGATRPWWLVMLRDEPYATVVAATLAAVGVGGVLLYRLWVQTRAINRLLAGAEAGSDSLAGVATRLARGKTRSVEAYYASRFAITRAYWRARVLSDLLHMVRAERASLEAARKAVHAQRRRLAEREATLQARLGGEMPDSPLARTVASVEALRAMAAQASSAFVGSEPVRRAKAVLHPYRDRKATVPYGDLEPLLAEVRRRAGGATLSDVLERTDIGPEATRRTWALVEEVQRLRRLGGGSATGTRLHLPLQVNRLDEDPKGVTGLDHPRLFLSDRVREYLKREEPGTGLGSAEREALLGKGKGFHDPDRLYFLQVAWGVHARSIPWLREAWPAPASEGADVLPLGRRRAPGEGS